MALSIGATRNGNAWKTCMVEKGRVIEQCAFEDAITTLAYLERTCAQYPELTLALSPACQTPYLALSKATSRQWESLLTFPLNDWTVQEANEFLIAIKHINLHSYLVPSPRYLPGMPLYRKLLHAALGSSNDVCAVAALLYRLSEKEATWPEMQFLFIQVNCQVKCIHVLEDGRIVNGMSSVIVTTAEDEQMNIAYGQALWEGLAQDIAGLMAIHHIEDIIVLGDYRDAFVDQFADSYQVYQFPLDEPGMEGFEAALGAGMIAEGLFLPGRSGDVVERLQIREACV
ncbi:MAG TPA: DUF1464 family protein [Ktedonobacteraceae bacterium]|nr:DUF1464 family protein [Ktedonobacteraceae bacterium]